MLTLLNVLWWNLFLGIVQPKEKKVMKISFVSHVEHFFHYKKMTKKVRSWQRKCLGHFFSPRFIKVMEICTKEPTWKESLVDKISFRVIYSYLVLVMNVKVNQHCKIKSVICRKLCPICTLFSSWLFKWWKYIGTDMKEVSCRQNKF